MDNGQVTTLGGLFFWSVERFNHNPLLQWESGDRKVAYSSADFETAVLKLALWFRAIGLSPGDRVGICSENRPEWHLVDFACHLARMIVVPVYPTLSAHQMEQVIGHAGVKILFCGPAQADRIAEVKHNLPELQQVIAFETLPSILASLAAATESERAALREQVMAEDPETIATLVYTSGTTGTPKGVMLSHRNIIFDAANSLKRLPERSNQQLALSVLPLSHVLERVLSYGYFYRGVAIAYGDPHDLKTLLPKYRPAILGAVPRVLEKMREAIDAQIARMPAHRRKISGFLHSVGYAHMDGNGSWKSRLHPAAEALMFRKVRAGLGNVEIFVVGGAWLNPELERYFRALGFYVVQGYGLTETSPVIAVNQYGAEKTGTVGRPIDGVEVKLDEDGEILTRGPHVMKGYYRDPEATAKVFRDGWFATGDLGTIDAEGYLTITGRRKEMLLLSNGKNVYYAPIEQALRQSRYIEQAFFVGEGRNYASAIVVPNRVALQQYADEYLKPRGMVFSSEEELLVSAPILDLYRKAIDEQQAGFSRFEQAKRFCFLNEDALLDIELVTPTQKVRRNVLERKYAAHIDRMYHQESPFVIAAPAPVASH